jgi:hypothetical protein
MANKSQVETPKSTFSDVLNTPQGAQQPQPQGPKNTFKRLTNHMSFTCSASLVQSNGFLDYLNVLTEYGEIPIDVLVLAYAYIKKCIEGKSSTNLVQSKGIKVLYGVCVFLAYKYLVETDYWPLEQFCKLVGVKKYTLFKYEIFIIDKYLNFELHMTKAAFDQQKKILSLFGLK